MESCTKSIGHIAKKETTLLLQSYKCNVRNAEEKKKRKTGKGGRDGDRIRGKEREKYILRRNSSYSARNPTKQ